jgi:hypothetical protein
VNGIISCHAFHSLKVICRDSSVLNSQPCDSFLMFKRNARSVLYTASDEGYGHMRRLTPTDAKNCLPPGPPTSRLQFHMISDDDAHHPMEASQTNDNAKLPGNQDLKTVDLPLNCCISYSARRRSPTESLPLEAVAVMEHRGVNPISATNR